MKKLVLSCVAVLLAFSFSGCGVLVDTDTPKSSELSSQYNFYSDSVNEIRTGMKITPEQADDVFIALTECGLNEKVTYISDRKASDTTYYNVSYGGNSLDVYLNDGAIQHVKSGDNILYPGLSDEDIQRLIDEVTLGIGEADTASVACANRVISVDVTLGNISGDTISAIQLAASRVSTITDGILNLESVYPYWDSVTIAFDGIGEVTRTKSDVRTNEFGGRYFNSSDFEHELS